MMSNSATTPGVMAASDPERMHRLRLRMGAWGAALFLLALLAYGFDYYFSSLTQRALSPKHVYLKPSGTIGLHLGMVGLLLFALVYLYPLRKHWSWLGRQGTSRHWLDFHVVLGITAPLIVTFHSAFKFSGLAGIAYWLMILVALSGVVGRYIYAQIPSTTAAELSLKDAQERSASLTAQLKALGVLSEMDVESLRPPDIRDANRMSLLVALGAMIRFDVLFPLRVRRLRRKAIRGHGTRPGWIGSRGTEHVELERAISLAREQAQLAKRVAFLSKSRQLLHLWHLIHRPFSSSFAVLAAIHVILMVMLGFY